MSRTKSCNLQLFLGTVVSGFVEVFEIVNKTYRLAQFDNGQNNNFTVFEYLECQENKGSRIFGVLLLIFSMAIFDLDH
jgi:lysyl-tRNA synthetase class II